MKKKLYPWLICLMCTLLISCCMGITNGTFAVFQPYLVESGLSNTQASLIVTIRNVFGVASMAFINHYYNKMKLRLGMTVAVLIGCLGFILYAVAQTFPMYLIAAALAGICYGLGGILPASLIIRRWFRQNRTLALGISGSGSGVAMMILPPILLTIIERYSAKTAFWFDALLMAVIAVLLYLTIREYPEDMGMAPWGDVEQQEKTRVIDQGTGLTRVEYVLMLISMLCMGIGTQPEVNHLTVFYHEQGFPNFVAPMVISIIGFSLIVGKCIYGVLVDKIGSYRINAIFYLGIIAGLVLFVAAGKNSTYLAYAGGGFLGFGTTLATVGMMTIAGDLDRPENYMKTGKNFQITYLAAVLCFSTVPGIVADITGSYRPVYLLAPCVMAAGMILTLLVYFRHHKSQENQVS